MKKDLRVYADDIYTVQQIEKVQRYAQEMQICCIAYTDKIQYHRYIKKYRYPDAIYNTIQQIEKVQRVKRKTNILMQMKNKFKKYTTRDREKIVNTTNVVKKDRFQDDRTTIIQFKIIQLICVLFFFAVM